MPQKAIATFYGKDVKHKFLNPSLKCLQELLLPNRTAGNYVKQDRPLSDPRRRLYSYTASAYNRSKLKCLHLERNAKT